MLVGETVMALRQLTTSLDLGQTLLARTCASCVSASFRVRLAQFVVRSLRVVLVYLKRVTRGKERRLIYCAPLVRGRTAFNLPAFVH